MPAALRALAAALMAKYRWQMADGGWQKAQVVGVAISEAAFCHQAQPAIRHPPSAIYHPPPTVLKARSRR
jgi:hypothetical protein